MHTAELNGVAAESCSVVLTAFESILLNYFPEIRDMQTIQILEDTYLYKLVKEKTKYKSFITATNQK